MSDARSLPLVPYPREVTRQPGQFPWGALPVSLPASAATPAIRHKLKALGLGPVTLEGGEPWTLRIGTPRMEGLVAPRQREGYVLRAGRQGVAIGGADADGLFWGLVTLEQLVLSGTRPCIEIRDWPEFEWRYHHDDVSRKQVSTVADFKRIVRLLSSYKIKYYTPYLEDMLYLRSHPDIGQGRGRLMPGEVRAMLAEARRHNVTVFPTFTLIGHQENLLQHPRYRTYAREVFQPPSSFDPTKPALRPFLRQVIRDVCELFPDAPFVHAGFDETQGVAEQDLIAHANWCASELGRHGKRMLMWVDMFKNHFGIKALHRLSPNITPVEWMYGDPAPVVARYRAAGVRPVGLAGYNNWGCHLPDFRLGKANVDQWITAARRLRSPGFGASQWGDTGYENSRDLCWNLFAYYAEAVWTGNAQHGAGFERRFQSTFYGRPLKPLARLIEDLAPRRQIPPRENWALFREGLPNLVRRVTVEPGLARRAAADLGVYRAMLKAVAQAKALARREAEQLDHFTVAIERQRLVCERLVLARRVARGLAGTALQQALASSRQDLLRVRELYRTVWLRQNKRPNIEVSLAVFDAVAESLEAVAKAPALPTRSAVMLDLGTACDAFESCVAGLPLAPSLYQGVPFRFAGRERTHARLAEGRAIRLVFDPVAVRDLHLLCAGTGLPLDARARDLLLEVRLLREGRCVFAESLRMIRHICDWFAPRGEHMWAGGGLRYVDPGRVRFAFSPGAFHGVMHVNGFGTNGCVADTLELRALPVASAPRAGVALFAATLESARPGLRPARAAGLR